jgi:Cu(I)/Ag(I) efflux system membrane protein CusA/SilA
MSHFKPRWISSFWNTVTVGRYYKEENHPISRVLFKIYGPVCRWVLDHRAVTIGGR